MNAEAIVGKLTQEETEELACACLEALPEDARYRVIQSVLPPEQIAELTD